MYEAILRLFSSWATAVGTVLNFAPKQEYLIVPAAGLIAVTLAFATATIASKKEGDFLKWFVAGAFIGFIALPMAIRKKKPAAEPPILKNCPNCPERVEISALMCKSCDYNFLSGMVGHRHKLLPHHEPSTAETPRRNLAYGS